MSALGRAAAAARTAAASQLLCATKQARLSAHGDLDEELVSLREYQRTYEAADRVISAVDEALCVLVNRTGRGRG